MHAPITWDVACRLGRRVCSRKGVSPEADTHRQQHHSHVPSHNHEYWQHTGGRGAATRPQLAHTISRQAWRPTGAWAPAHCAWHIGLELQMTCPRYPAASQQYYPGCCLRASEAWGLGACQCEHKRVKGHQVKNSTHAPEGGSGQVAIFVQGHWLDWHRLGGH